jgi:phosphatidylserine/phosphatidylglycerophosphate/cardiolipin synthase-like enzyme
MKTLWDRDIFEKFSVTHLCSAERFVWIATANIKMTFLRYKSKFVSFPDLMAILVNRGVSFRIIHSEVPSKPFRDRYERIDTKGKLSAGVEFLQCPRMHSKLFIVDGSSVMVGSANLTGAGIGAKSGKKRNFEIGFLLEGQEDVEPFVDYFDFIWMGGHCTDCGYRSTCPGPADT